MVLTLNRIEQNLLTILLSGKQVLQRDWIIHYLTEYTGEQPDRAAVNALYEEVRLFRHQRQASWQICKYCKADISPTD